MEILGFLIIAFFCFLTVHSSITVRKHYNNDYEELSGEVISFDKHYEKNGKNRDVFYDIEVYAENGRTYNLSTNNIKGHKYRNKKDIVILVSNDYTEPTYEEDNANIDNLINEWTNKGELNENTQELISCLNKLKEINKMPEYKKSGSFWIENKVILKEERPSVFVMVFVAVLGMIFLFGAIGTAVAYIIANGG